jgi:transposase-like protein
VESAFPPADVQLCVVHHIRNVTKFVSWKDRGRPPRTRSLRTILGSSLSHVGCCLAYSLGRTDSFFKYPVELRRMIYTTNAIESLHSQMRKNISDRKVFPNDEAVVKILSTFFIEPPYQYECVSAIRPEFPVAPVPPAHLPDPDGAPLPPLPGGPELPE